jgi:toxin ParE1/3/4
MKRVRFDPGAYAQLAAIRLHIAADNPSAADRVVKRIEGLAALLAEYPDMGHKLRHRPERVMPVSPYPYLIFYRVVGDELHVLQVRHSARRRPMLQEEAAEFRR